MYNIQQIPAISLYDWQHLHYILLICVFQVLIAGWETSLFHMDRMCGSHLVGLAHVQSETVVIMWASRQCANGITTVCLVRPGKSRWELIGLQLSILVLSSGFVFVNQAKTTHLSGRRCGTENHFQSIYFMWPNVTLYDVTWHNVHKIWCNWFLTLFHAMSVEKTLTNCYFSIAYTAAIGKHFQYMFNGTIHVERQLL